MAMKKEDWIVLTLDASGGKPYSPVQLQKALFLLKNEEPGKEVRGEYYNFSPYNYGPFDAAIYSDARTLSDQGLISIETRPDQRWPNYLITAAGKERAAELKKEASARAVAYLQVLAEWIHEISFQQLLKAVYSKYPAYAKNSVFKH